MSVSSRNFHGIDGGSWWRPIYRLERHQLLPRPVGEVFPFFTDASNLERLTPAFLNFHIETPAPIDMRAGTLIDYRLRLFGVPLRWRTVIEEYELQSHFIDRQLKGPYLLWRHLHDFESHLDGTMMTDRVLYRLPAGPLGRLAHGLFVKRSLRRIFDFRHQVLEEFDWHTFRETRRNEAVSR